MISPSKIGLWTIRWLIRQLCAKHSARGFIHVCAHPHSYPMREVLSVPFCRVGKWGSWMERQIASTLVSGRAGVWTREAARFSDPQLVPSWLEGPSTAATRGEKEMFAAYMLKGAPWKPLFHGSSKKELLLCLQGREVDVTFLPKEFPSPHLLWENPRTFIGMDPGPNPAGGDWKHTNKAFPLGNVRSGAFLKVKIKSDKASVKEPEPWQVARTSRRDNHTSPHEKGLQRKSLQAVGLVGDTEIATFKPARATYSLQTGELFPSNIYICKFSTLNCWALKNRS